MNKAGAVVWQAIMVDHVTKNPLLSPLEPLIPCSMTTDHLDQVLFSLKRFYKPDKIDLSLDRLNRLLAKLGNPQDHLPPVIHVTGTNGKGSTIAYMRAMLEAAGYACHVYTSPHLVTFNERIRLAGELISDEMLLALIAEVEAANGEDVITFFEITTAMAFLAFARIPADVLLLEVGLGGRLDATNVVKLPLLSVITTLSYDHCEWLGDTLAEIAGEKAGIMKDNVPCIIGHQLDWVRDEVMPVFQEHARRRHCDLISCEEDWFVESNGSEIIFSFKNKEDLILPRPGLLGHHQIWNAGTAIASLMIQDIFDVPVEAIRQGLSNVSWPARLERIEMGSLACALPPEWELWYDGGHNDSGGLALSEQIAHWDQEDGKMLHVVCGMLKSKKPEDFLKPILPFAKSLATFSFETCSYSEAGPARKGEDLAAAIRPFYSDVTVCRSLREAVRSLPERYGDRPGRILVTGTLYAYKDLKAA